MSNLRNRLIMTQQVTNSRLQYSRDQTNTVKRVRRRSSFDTGGINFWCTYDGSTVNINAGHIYFHGLYTVDVSESTCNLSADTEWVYILNERNSQSYEIQHSVTQPQSDSQYYRFALAKFNLSDGWYVKAEQCAAGDIHLDTPIAPGYVL